MALTSTVYTFIIDLADNDRGVYESFELRVARHPSESEEYLWTRVLAYAAEYADGIAFSKGGLSDPDDPPIAIRDLTGAIRSWIDIGTPDVERLHRASKAAPAVAVYVHRDASQWLQRLKGARVHEPASIAIWEVDRDLLAHLTARLQRRMAFSLSVTDRELFLAFESDTVGGALRRVTPEWA